MAAVIFLRWYFNCIYFGGGQLAFKTIFFFVKNTSIHGQKVLNPFFFFDCQIVFLLSTNFFIQFTQSAMFEKNSQLRLPTFQINFFIIDQIYLHY